MNETKVKNRGWVKNAAIIFLAVLLVLTFFSNTILNRSLPEVAGVYAQSGSITTRVRGSGTVEANDEYEVSLNQSREVLSVAIRVGDEVSVGDILLYLSGKESSELEAAQDQLYNLQIEYNKAIIQAMDSDYTRENRDIELEREVLAELELERDELQISDDTINAKKVQLDAAEAAVKSGEAAVKAAEQMVRTAQNAVDKEQDAYDKIANELSGLIPPSEGSPGSSYAPVQAAKTELDAQKLAYGDIYDEITSFAKANRGSATLEAYMLYLYNTNYTDVDFTIYVPYDDAMWAEAYEAITKAQEAYNAAQEAYSPPSSGGGSSQYNKKKRELDAQKDVLDARKSTLKTAQNALRDEEDKVLDLRKTRDEIKEEYDKLVQNRDDYRAAVKAVKTQENKIENMIFELSEKQKADDKSGQIESLNLQARRKEISDLQTDIYEMQKDGEGAEISSPVAGTISRIDVTAGNTVNPGQVLIVIDVTDRGYSLSFPVSNEQARNLQVGTEAEVTMNYWNRQDISAMLTAIRTDPQNPSSSKLLTFTMSGEVTAGATYSITVGQRSANYEIIVPNSAVKSDSNGDFILIVEEKSNPISTRYIARRIDVTVIASDDIYSAVSGAVTNADFVITTATKPIEAGTQVKIPD